MKQAAKLLLISLGGLSISACSGSQLVKFSVIQQSNQCHIQAPEIVPLSSKKEQAEFIKRYSLFKAPETRDNLTQLFDKHAQYEPLFIVAQGQKSSAGYGFDIQGDQAKLDNEQLTLPIFFKSPAQDAYLAQVMTSPCLVLGIDSNAHYTSLYIDGLEINLPE